MARVRFPTRWTTLRWLPALVLWSPAILLAQSKSLFPNRNAPAQSSALRFPPRRPLPPPRPDTVALPFHLLWGDTQNRLSSLFAGVGAKVTNKKAEGPAEIWTVDGLIAPNLQASLFTFAQGGGGLVGLEFDYGEPDWTTDNYNEAMGQFRRLLDEKCEKPGEVISRQTDQATGGSVTQSLMGYQWKRGDTLVQLFYFSAEDPAKSLAYRSISVHYHYQQIVEDITPLPDAGRNLDPNANALFGGTKAAPSAGPSPDPTPAVAPPYGPPPPPTPTPKPGSRDSADPLPER